MSDYLSLDEAAAKLGIPNDRLVDLRSQGQVRGFRDGASWKFPQAEIDRLAEELADSGAGSGFLADDSGLGLAGGSGLVIGGDDTPVEGGSGSDLGIGNESLTPGSGSDVNLVTSEGDDGSDVALVADNDGTDPSDSDLPSGLDVGELLEIDSAELKLEEPAITHDSAMIDVAIEPKEGSTGPVAKKPTKTEEPSSPESDLGLSASLLDEDDSDDLVLGDDDSSGMNVLGSDLDLSSVDSGEDTGGKASSLELLDELNAPDSESGSLMSSGADVLSELDLLGAEQGGSGLISGDSANLLAGSGSVLGSDSKDDALADDDDLVIADDDDDLVIDSQGSDISIAGDSGINLMSPSDSGLSLESEPLDLAGSSISALDLGAELAEEGSGIGSDVSGPGSGVDFQADEEFQLSPSGIGLEADMDSGSQVIEVEESEAIGEAVEFEDAGFGDAGGGDVFAPATVESDPGGAVAFDQDDQGGGMAVVGNGASAGVASYEVPFTTLQCVSLALIMGVMGLCGMLMTDLVRNMWTYTEPAAPVSSLTGFLIDLMGW
tara:strand:+ start:233944 stop:235587 length:1644 start_codon:yes stop_codon:yes gene_type:complete